MSAQPTTRKTRAEINRENAQKSTGPKSKEGKAASSRNAFKHGIYSEEIVIPGENLARYEALLADLRAEHQPSTPTEELLVDELAQHFWHIRRWRKMETQMYIAKGEGEPGNQPIDSNHLMNYVDCGLFNVLHRSLASAERNFHRTLTSLLRLKKQNGFVPSEPRASEQAVSEPRALACGASAQSASDGFVPAEPRASASGKSAQPNSAVASFDKFLSKFPFPTSIKAA